MKNFNIIRSSILAFTLLNLSLFSFGQNEQDVITLFGRICQTDSIKSALGQTKEGPDSLTVFHFKTPDVNTFGIAEYEYQDFFLNFDTGSNFLFKGIPFGSIQTMDITSKKAFIVVHIEGTGDRLKSGRFEKASYTFANKKDRWMLKGVSYE